VLKADGYGHGAKAVARTLERAGAKGLCVALLEEGIELREAGIKIPVLVMGGHYGRAWGELLHHDLVPVVHDPSQIEALAEEVKYTGTDRVGIHLKVDTGMGRLGVVRRDLTQVGQCLLEHPEVRLDGLMTHFPCADHGPLELLDQQLDRFEEAARVLGDLGLRPKLRHAAGSGALLRHERARLDIVRPGIAVFGVEPSPGLCPELKPAMRIRTEIVALRQLEVGESVGYGSTWTAKQPSLIATIPMGYADGLSRALSNRGDVLVRGARAPIAGIVSMDMTMLDVSGIDGARVGDECVVLGSQKGQNGESTVTATEIATHLESIPWEVLTNVSRRVPRFYREP
jgi:alanine racemase